VLPLAEPLERVAGLRAAMARGADCTVLPLHQVGLTGAASFDVALFHAAVLRHEPHSMTLRPALLRAWSAHLHATRHSAPRTLLLVVVAGSAVGERALMEAHAAGIPAYEGYSPSQGGLLQTLNLPGADLPGSVGRALPHAQLRCTAHGEIETADPQLPDRPRTTSPAWQPTGDLGRMDAQGFVHLTGHTTEGLTTATGHPAPPDWAQATLRGGPCMAQVSGLVRPAEHP
jgi:acyl-coenzyme A synthetase/AMP-(fatty) acid ligase